VRPRPSLRTLTRLLIAAVFVCTLSADPQQYEGRTISSISFDPPAQPVDSTELSEILPLKLNTPLHLADVHRTIDRMFATGRYQDIAIDAQPSGPDGVAIVIATKNSWFIGRVSIEGKIPEPPNASQLVNASRLDLGEPFNQADVKTAQSNIVHLLVQDGFYEAAVTPSLDYSDVADQVNIAFHIEPGRRARLWLPTIAGNPQLPEHTIIRATHWKKLFIDRWQPISQARVRQGLDGVRAKFGKSDRLLATVELKSLDFDQANRRATPHLEIQAGPVVTIKAVGAKVKRKTMEDNIPVFQEHAVDPDLLEEGRRNLQEEFQSKGYFEAAVQYKQMNVVQGRQEIDYEIDPGARHRFVKLAVQGNKYFTTEAIRERLFLQPKSFQFRTGRYSEAFTRRDEQSIANLYKSNGFRDVIVTADTQDNYLGRANDVGVTLNIVEGVQYLVSTLAVTGNSLLDLKSILPTLSSAEAQPFSDFNVAADRDAILTYYFENGFPNAAFEYATTTGADPRLVNLQFRIVEGKRQFVRQVVTSGLLHTRAALVERNITMKPADPLSPVEMSEIQKRLYDLGVFAKVDMAVQNADGDTERKYVIYDMQEARRYSVTAGFGAQLANIGGSNAADSLANPAGAAGFSPRVSLDVTRINFLGLGHTVRFSSRYSSLDSRGLIDYLWPKFYGHPKLDLKFTVLFDDAHDVRTFAAKRAEASVQFTDRFSKSLTAFLRFTYRDVNVSNLKIAPELLPLLSQSVRIGILSANLVQDRRDDPTDAHKGIYNTLDIGLAARQFGSNSSFARLLARNATYHPIGKKLVLARQTSFGIEPAFSTPRNSDPNDAIPLPERFYGGGGNSLRGFPENQAGPRDHDTGFPLGGSALFFNTTELRFPLLGENVGGVVFHDVGNVFDRIGDFSFRFSQKNPQDFNYLVHAVGFGIRYKTPFGPVRVDLADSINAPRFNGFSGTYQQLVQCAINNTCVAAPQRVSRFQFFFSIGQAF
jgi:outer membrane protein insertion porin family